MPNLVKLHSANLHWQAFAAEKSEDSMQIFFSRLEAWATTVPFLCTFADESRVQSKHAITWKVEIAYVSVGPILKKSFSDLLHIE